MCWIRSACVLLLGACAATDDAADACVDGAAFAGALPAAHDAATFTELWRVGGGADAQLAMPLPLAVSAEGRAAIADFMLGELFVVEPDGSWRGRIARRGKGPGELTSPVAAVWDAAGVLHVYDITKPAILRFAPDLSYMDERRVQSITAAAIYAAGSLEWAGVQPSGATAFLPGPSDPEQGSATELALRVEPSGIAVDTLRSGRIPVVSDGDWSGTELPGHSKLSAWVGAGGVLALIGGYPGWLVDVYDDHGSRVLRLCAAAPASPLSDAELGRNAPEEMRDLARAFTNATPPADPARHGRIVLGADGTIWVQRERRRPFPEPARFYGDPGTTWDVFSAAGEYDRTLEMPRTARLQGALGDTVWVYELTGLEEVDLVAYRVDMQ